MIAPTDSSIDALKAQQAKEAEPREEFGGQMDFLRMFITQLEHQDPMNPQDSTEFATQLAQFSSLEAEVGTRDAIDKLVELQQEMLGGDGFMKLGGIDRSLLMSDMIGKEILASGSAVQLPPLDDSGNRSAETSFLFDLESGASDVKIDVIDPANPDAILATLELGPLSPGRKEQTWDGTTWGGSKLQGGVYEYRVRAEYNGDPVPVTTFLQGQITGTVPDAENPKLRMGPVEIDMDEVIEIYAGAST